MSDDTKGAERRVPPAGDTADTTPKPAAGPKPGGSGETASGSRSSNPPTPGGAARRRRRGSRGGRNRRRPRAAAEGGGSGGSTPQTGATLEERHEDYTDAAADRGITTEDLAATAKEEAGLRVAPESRQPKVGDTRPAPRAAPKPRVGDSRAAPRPPAPAGKTDGGTGTPTKRRRRRGGRGRSKRGSGATEVVRGDVGFEELPGGDLLDQLDDDTLERRRGRTRKGKPAGRYLMCVHVHPGGPTQVAVLEGRSLVEHYVSWPKDDVSSIDGNIYLAKVQNVLPGMEAAFVDIGTPKNAVLYRGDVAFDPDEVEERQPRIEQLLKNGQAIIVQVTKNPIGHKGARLTQEVSLAGRFVVMVPGQAETSGISKRLPDDERKRLRRVLEGLRPPDAGLIVRTAAEGAMNDELERDLKRLEAQWQQISELAARSKPPKLIYQEPSLVVRIIREEFNKEYRQVVIDDRELYEEVRGYVDAVAPELADRIELFDSEEEGMSVFERFHVHEQLVKALDKKVWLPSGGSLVIERTEALTVIDVNTGKNVGKSNLEETVFRNNLEAADEIARQLRLRDIGGIIVIDFIDMEILSNRDEVIQRFRDALARDKTRTQVFDISELGLVEMTRKRISEGLVEAFSYSCQGCGGRGFVIDDSLL